MNENNINMEERLWNYIDGLSAAEERSAIEQLLESNVEWHSKYRELLEVHKLLKETELEEPSMRFTRNVMEEISRLQIAPATRNYINKKIIYGLGAFFVALFTAGGAILTPELKTDAAWPAWLQLGIAASMFSPRTCVLGAAGILALYGYGAALYGAFHLADYPVFLGLAAYMALTSCGTGRLRRLRMPILQASLCASLMWAAVEKWAYPQWTFPLLEERPWLLFGVLPSDFMVVAGFVEFAFAFHMLTGFALSRVGILALGAIFGLAILDFGKLDAIGHLPILATMAAMFVHGPTPLQRRLHEIRRGLLAEARRAGLAFAAAVCVFVSAYYGLQRAEHGGGNRPEARGGGRVSVAAAAAPVGR